MYQSFSNTLIVIKWKTTKVALTVVLFYTQTIPNFLVGEAAWLSWLAQEMSVWEVSEEYGPRGRGVCRANYLCLNGTGKTVQLPLFFIFSVTYIMGRKCIMHTIHQGTGRPSGGSKCKTPLGVLVEISRSSWVKVLQRPRETVSLKFGKFKLTILYCGIHIMKPTQWLFSQS